MKKKNSSIAGVTLVEILIGIVISMIMMAAMFTSYQAVNNSYSQVIDRAKISQTGRNILGMIVKDIRLAGFKYFDEWSEMLLDQEARELQRRKQIVAEEVMWASRGVKARVKRNLKRLERAKQLKEQLLQKFFQY